MFPSPWKPLSLAPLRRDVPSWTLCSAPSPVPQPSLFLILHPAACQMSPQGRVSHPSAPQSNQGPIHFSHTHSVTQQTILSTCESLALGWVQGKGPGVAGSVQISPIPGTDTCPALTCLEVRPHCQPTKAQKTRALLPPRPGLTTFLTIGLLGTLEKLHVFGLSISI